MRAVSKSSAVPIGPGVCPRVAPLGFGLKFPYLTQEDMGQNCSRMDCGQTVRIGDRRLVVYLMAVDPFALGDQPGGRQRMEKLMCRPLLQQLGLEVIGSVARPPLALYLVSGSTGLSGSRSA